MHVSIALSMFDDRRRLTTEGLVTDFITCLRQAIGFSSILSMRIDGAIVNIGPHESTIHGVNFSCTFDNRDGSSFIEGSVMSAFEWFGRSDEVPEAISNAC